MTTDPPQTNPWLAVDGSLAPPFNTWPRWAVELDIEIADRQGDIAGAEEPDASQSARIEELEWARNALAHFVAKAVTP